MDGSKIAANVSVNKMDFNYNGALKHYIQLGTVMTDKAYRNQGLIRRIMREIEADFAGQTDGFYLFANDSVLDFYPKFGFEKTEEYRCWKEIEQTGERTAVQVPMEEKRSWNKLEEAIHTSIPNGSFEMLGNSSLIMFYITKSMRENVFYIESLDAYIIAELEKETLYLDNIYAKQKVNINDVIKAFGSSVKKVVLNFTPLDTGGFHVELLKQEGLTLFVRGEDIKELCQRKLMFPELSHA